MLKKKKKEKKQEKKKNEKKLKHLPIVWGETLFNFLFYIKSLMSATFR